MPPKSSNQLSAPRRLYVSPPNKILPLSVTSLYCLSMLASSLSLFCILIIKLSLYNYKAE
nr:MAG TPA: hypothetical protein [Caudoviricetes sp.]